MNGLKIESLDQHLLHCLSSFYLAICDSLGVVQLVVEGVIWQELIGCQLMLNSLGSH